MNNIWSYISLGITGFNVVMQLITLLKVPGMFTVDTVWPVIQPLLASIGAVAGVSINMVTAKQIVTDAIDTILAAHPPKPLATVAAGLVAHVEPQA
jgi:hypothetical protein